MIVSVLLNEMLSLAIGIPKNRGSALRVFYSFLMVRGFEGPGSSLALLSILLHTLLNVDAKQEWNEYI